MMEVEEREEVGEAGRGIPLSREFWNSIGPLALLMFLAAFKPSEPHLTVYLTDELGFTENQVNDLILTAGPYAYVVLLPLIGPLAEVLGYRMGICIGMALRVITRVLLLATSNLGLMVVMDITYAGGLVAETLVYAYVFRVVHREQYRWGTAVILSSYAFSHVLSGIVGDLLVNFVEGGLVFTFWVSLVTVSAGFMVALVGLPKPLAPRPIEAMEGEEYAMLAGSEEEDSERGEGVVEGEIAGKGSKSWQEIWAVYWKSIVESWTAFQTHAVLRWVTVAWIGCNVGYTVIYGWETSVAADVLTKGPAADWNGTILGVGLLSMIASSSLAAHERVVAWTQHSPVLTALICSLVLAASGIITTISSPYALALGLIFFFAAYGFVDAFFKANAGIVLSTSSTSSTTTTLHPYSTYLTLAAAAAAILQAILQAISLNALQIGVVPFFIVGAIFAAIVSGIAYVASLQSKTQTQPVETP